MRSPPQADLRAPLAPAPPRSSRGFARAFALAGLALAGLAQGGSASSSGVEALPAGAWPAPAPAAERRVGPHLAALLRASRRAGFAGVAAEARRRGIDRAPDGTVELQVVARDGRTWLRPATLADVPSLLADPTVRTLSLPAPVRPARLVEGVGLTGADLAHASGARGGGCRLAIVDAGFDGYSELVARGAAPVPAATLDLTSSGLEKTSKHGAAVAEIAHAMAPDAALLLVKVAHLGHFDDALDWVAKKKAHVVNLSIGFPGTNFSDGTGAAAKAVKKARKKGVLPVAAAGNFGDGHWLGAWHDPDGDRFLDFDDGDEGLTLQATAGSDVVVHLVWDAFPTTSVDLDLAAYWVGTEANPVPPGQDTLQDFSTTIQDGHQPPLEVVAFEAPFTGRYAVFVNRVAKKPGKVAVFASHPVVDGNGVAASSLVTPGDAAAAFTVGALGAMLWTTGPVQPYSSRGPNLAGVPKPALVGPDGTMSAVPGFDPFHGTSAASPHVAGAACLVRSVQPSLGPDGIEARLVAAALPVPGATTDEAGAGRLSLAFDFTPPAPNPAGISDSSSTSADSATLMAVVASDVSGPVEYRFECVAGGAKGGDGRDWAAAATFLDDGLEPDRKYAYRVRVRDAAAPLANETEWSEVVKVRTLARTPGVPVALKVKATSVKIALDVVDNPKSVEYAVWNETDGVWVGAKGKGTGAAVWRTAAAWGDGKVKVKGLEVGTEYGIRVAARNGEGVETGLGGVLVVVTGEG